MTLESAGARSLNRSYTPAMETITSVIVSGVSGGGRVATAAGEGVDAPADEDADNGASPAPPRAPAFAAQGATREEVLPRKPTWPAEAFRAHRSLRALRTFGSRRSLWTPGAAKGGEHPRGDGQGPPLGGEGVATHLHPGGGPPDHHLGRRQDAPAKDDAGGTGGLPLVHDYRAPGHGYRFLTGRERPRGVDGPVGPEPTGRGVGFERARRGGGQENEKEKRKIFFHKKLLTLPPVQAED